MALIHKFFDIGLVVRYIGQVLSVALCHHFTTASPLNTALGDERVKGLGGGKKAASKRGSQSWEKFLKDHPDREIK